MITGASSGIGRATALALDRAGWRVFAGVRTRKAAADLGREASSRLTPVILDVTQPARVAATAAEIRASLGREAGLDALVSNAGIMAAVGPLEFTATDAVRRQLEVNLIGHLVVIKAFLPALRKRRGRIVVVGSLSGRMPLPLMGGYMAAEHALEAVCDVLRVELRPWRVPVSLIEASLIRTPIWAKGEKATLASRRMRPAAVGGVYARMMDRGWSAMRRVYGRWNAPPERVAAVVLRIMEARRPKARYGAGVFSGTVPYYRLVPARLVDAVLGRFLS
ncbi:MAG: SDR family oxidoreductase, partial [Candidatus Aminicenantes bacterium]|nr:SDR family oxidoreductase [Candidatus Aminicenantes bacterium]